MVRRILLAACVAGSLAAALPAVASAGTISGHVFDDFDGDAVLPKEATEAAKGNVTVGFSNNGDLVPEVTTTSNATTGNYTSPNLAAGTWNVLVPASGAILQTTQIYTETVTSGSTTTGKDLGVFTKPNYSGVVFEDMDGDGVKDAGDTGMSGVPVELDFHFDQLIDETQTPANGAFSFAVVPGTNHNIDINPPGGLFRTTTAPANFSPRSAQNVSTGFDFGVFEGATARGRVFADSDGDLTNDPGEAGRSGVTIQVDHAANGSVDFTTTTDGNGDWSVAFMSPATYRFRAVMPGGLTQTSSNPADVTPQSGQTINGIDFATAAPPAAAGASGGAAGGGTAGGAAGGAVGAAVRDLLAPTAALAGKRSQKLDASVETVVDCTKSVEDCLANGSGTISVPGSSKVFRLKGVRGRRVARGKKATLKLRVPKKALRSGRRALRRGKRIRARVGVTVLDAAGNAANLKRTIRLR